MEQHLERNYMVKHTGDRCLNYHPGKFTRLPNCYYTFGYSGIDFFALDSNTFDRLITIPDTEAGKSKKEELLARLSKLEDREQEIRDALAKLSPNLAEQMDKIDDYRTKLVTSTKPFAHRLAVISL